ncbi:MAG: tRNA 2-thiouridine(34) synthase MnmA [Blautia sp.]|jgi:tRNA-specific 2-thiouridylase
MDKKKIVIGMSGGVDSSVAAYLLKKAGYEVAGVTMQTWGAKTQDEAERTPGIAEDAKRVASALGISHEVVDFHEVFEKHVMDYFVREYLCGRTPNPCVVCNHYVKWEALLSYARSIGADGIATGHYARVHRLGNGRYTLRRAAGDKKDQTYALYQLSQEQLSHTLMPVGNYTKDQIREIADQIGLEVANKPDSQEICFIPDHDYASFIRRRTGILPEEGNFVDGEGTVLGRHKGIIHYTVGQRKGLGIALGRPVFVKEIRPKTNEVVLADNAEVFAPALTCNQLKFMGMENIEDGMEVFAKIRYNHQGAPCTLYKRGEDLVECRFREPQRAITPGQAVVFYREDYVLGGGTIVGAVSS